MSMEGLVQLFYVNCKRQRMFEPYSADSSRLKQNSPEVQLRLLPQQIHQPQNL